MKLTDYISGSRRGEEANRIERQAMRDPFLHEALDGYERVPHDSDQALLDLQKEIRKRTSNRRKYLVIRSSVASILIFIMVGGYFVFKTGQHQFDNLVTQEIPDITVLETAPLPPATTEKTVETPVQSVPEKKKKPDTIPVKVPAETIPEEKKTEEKVITASTQERLRPATADLHVTGTGKVFGMIVDDYGEPVMGANVLVRNTTNGTLTDIDGYFELNANPGDELQVSYIGYQTLNIPVKEGSMQIAMREDSQVLDEVVVMGYGTQKKASMTGSVSQVKKAPRKSKPVDGYKSFKKYIQENKDYDEKATVVLLFSIDNWGRPVDIRVKSSTNEEAAEEAIRLLEDGPDWIKGRSNKEIKYTFRF